MGAGRVEVRDEVLLPPGERTPADLPPWVVVVAVVGLLVLGGSTLPAIVLRSRLEDDHARLRCEAIRQERELQRLRRALDAAKDDTFLQERALRSLLLPPGAADPAPPHR